MVLSWTLLSVYLSIVLGDFYFSFIEAAATSTTRRRCAAEWNKFGILKLLSNHFSENKNKKDTLNEVNHYNNKNFFCSYYHYYAPFVCTAVLKLCVVKRVKCGSLFTCNDHELYVLYEIKKLVLPSLYQYNIYITLSFLIHR